MGFTFRLYDGSEVVVAGKFKNNVDAPSDGKSPRGEIIGRTATEKRNFKIEFPKPVSRLNVHPVRQESSIRKSHLIKERCPIFIICLLELLLSPPLPVLNDHIYDSFPYCDISLLLLPRFI